MKRLLVFLSVFFFLGILKVPAQIMMDYFQTNSPQCYFEPVFFDVNLYNLTDEPDIVLVNNQPAFGTYQSSNQTYWFAAIGSNNMIMQVEVIEGGVTVFTDYLISLPTPPPIYFSFTPLIGDCTPGAYLQTDYIEGGLPPYLVNYTQNGISVDSAALLPGNVQVTVTDNYGCSLTGSYFIPSTVQSEIDLLLCEGTSEATYLGNQYTAGQYILPAGLSVGGCDSTVLLNVSASPFTPVVGTMQVGCDTAGLVGASNVQQDYLLTFDWQVQTGGPGAIYSKTENTMTGEIGGNYMWLIQTGYCTDTIIYNAAPATGMGITLQYSQCKDSLTVTNISGGTGPFTYAWSDNILGTNSEGNVAMPNLYPEMYTVTVYDSQGCAGATSAFKAINFSALPPYFSCGSTFVGSINYLETGPFSYEWSGPDGFTATGLNAQLAENGTYSLIVTNNNGCENALQIEKNIPEVTFYHCEDALVPAVEGYSEGAVIFTYYNLIPNFQYVCAGCFETPYPGPGFQYTYNMSYGSETCMNTNFDESDVIQDCPTGVKGHVYLDANDNCSYNSTIDYNREAAVLLFDNGTEITTVITNHNGHYLTILAPGTYTVTIANMNSLIEAACQLYTVTVLADSLHVLDLGISPTIDCPVVETKLTPGFLRRCMNSSYYASVCNIGTTVAVNPTVTIVLDPLFEYMVASPNPTNISGDSLYFELNDLAPTACQNIVIFSLLSCDAALNQVLCAQGFATPAPTCLPDQDGIMVSVEGYCNGDSVAFKIQNLDGQLDNVEYIIIEDQLIFMQEPFNLVPDGEINISVPADGAVHWAGVKTLGSDITDVVASALVLGCGASNVSNPIVNQFTLNDNLDEYPNTTETCDPVIGSYDPNDKQGVPVGYGAERNISVNTNIDYKIRFQNTGTDTAFNVVIRDTLPEWLDLTTLNLGLSSHYYQADLQANRVLVFNFPNIMLPDSFVNEATSHGFVNFSMALKPTTPLGTKIENSAAIYFDFNEPIITNQTLHTVAAEFVLTSVANQPDLKPWQVYPNPTSGLVQLRPVTNTGASNYTATLYNVLGQVVLQQDFTEQGGTIDCSNLKTGSYLLTVFEDGIQVVVRQLVVR